MTKEAQRIAIAEACDASFWRTLGGKILLLPSPPANPTMERLPADIPDLIKLSANVTHVPNYPEDLNAMHEAEECLTDEQWPQYRDTLRTVVLGPVRLVSQWCKADVHSTAAQRAEAFLRTIGKWVE